MFATIIIAAVVAVLFVLAARYAIKDMKSGNCASCGGNCGSHCTHPQQAQNKPAEAEGGTTRL